MDTQRTAQIVAWTLIGGVVGALVSALGFLYCSTAALVPQAEPAPWLGVVIVLVFCGAFGIPPGLVGGFLMGCFVAPLRALAWQIFWATAIGTGVGIGYGNLLASLVNEPQIKVFLLNFSTTAGAVGGFLMPLAIEVVRKALGR